MGSNRRPQPHDSWAKFYDHIYDQTYGQIYHGLTDITLKDISGILSSGGSIIDFGAGTGRLAVPLKKQGYDVTAIEISAGMVNVLQGKVKELGLELPIHNCSISHYAGSAADLALCLFTVLSYATTERELSGILDNIYNHLSPGGFFFFDLPNATFFHRNTLIEQKSADFSRTVKINPSNSENIYIYNESCSGNWKGQKFNINDELFIRYWESSRIDHHLKELGFFKKERPFSHYNSTGSTYHLYQKL